MAINTYKWSGDFLSTVIFEWDAVKDAQNRRKHGVSFAEAQYAFADPRRVIAIIRIIGAGYWRKGKAIYERENQIHG